MIPLKDENPTRIFPFVTILIIVANIVVFLVQLGLTPRGQFIFVHQFGVIPKALTSFTDPFPQDGLPVALTLLTSIFLHGGLWHLAGNMLFLWIFGNNIEDVLGHFRFIFFYFICGVLATLVHIVTDPGSTKPMIGASGAIAGVMGAYLILFPRAKVLTLILIIFYPVLVWVPAVFFLVLWFLFQFLNLTGAGDTGVAFTAHIGGFICGMIGVRLMMKHQPPPRRRLEFFSD